MTQLCGYGRLLRNPTLKVAGFHLPIPGWFWVPADKCHRADQNQPPVGTSKPASL